MYVEARREIQSCNNHRYEGLCMYVCMYAYVVCIEKIENPCFSDPKQWTKLWRTPYIFGAYDFDKYINIIIKL